MRKRQLVAPEGGNVLTRPAQGGHHIEQAEVSQRRSLRGLGGERGMGKQSGRPEAVVDRDDHDATPGKLAAIVARLCAGALDEGAAMNPKQHGQFRIRPGIRGRPDVQEEAVLALLAAAEKGFALKRGLAKSRGLAGAGPWLRRLWCLPAEVANGSGGVRDAAKDAHAFPLLADKLAAGNADGAGPRAAGAFGRRGRWRNGLACRLALAVRGRRRWRLGGSHWCARAATAIHARTATRSTATELAAQTAQSLELGLAERAIGVGVQLIKEAVGDLGAAGEGR
jgi:hypothetical protein